MGEGEHWKRRWKLEDKYNAIKITSILKKGGGNNQKGLFPFLPCPSSENYQYPSLLWKMYFHMSCLIPFGAMCLSFTGKPESSSAVDIHLNVLPQTKSGEVSSSGVRGDDCAVAKEMCQADDTCFKHYRAFQRVCRAKCNHQMEAQPCLAARKALEGTVLGNCTCPQPVQDKCTEVWDNIFNNTCLQHTQRFQASMTTKEIHIHEGTQGLDAGKC